MSLRCSPDCSFPCDRLQEVATVDCYWLATFLRRPKTAQGGRHHNIFRKKRNLLRTLCNSLFQLLKRENFTRRNFFLRNRLASIVISNRIFCARQPLQTTLSILYPSLSVWISGNPSNIGAFMKNLNLEVAYKQ